MSERRVGLWLIGAFGGVGTTAVLGLAALRRKLMPATGMVTALPMFDRARLDQPANFVVGGHDVRHSDFADAVSQLHERSGIFNRELVTKCRPDLDSWAKNVRAGTTYNTGATIAKLADHPNVSRTNSPRELIEHIRSDYEAFQSKHALDQMVVVNIASTEPPCLVNEHMQSVASVRSALEKDEQVLPASSLYAWAALDMGVPYINFTPSLGAAFPAAVELAETRRTACGGQDGKTGETMLKAVLAPMFAHRNLEILSWVGHNIFGNRDGLVLDDPTNKESKIRTKDQVVSSIVGYKPQTHVSIEYIESLDDWKTAWDHIHFRGFLGVKMALQFTWQGCDSILAAPLVLDLARLALLAQRRGETGVLRHLACFFKNPQGVTEHDFFKEFDMLKTYIDSIKS